VRCHRCLRRAVAGQDVVSRCEIGSGTSEGFTAPGQAGILTGAVTLRRCNSTSTPASHWPGLIGLLGLLHMIS
jgi:hypothetical protein